MKSPRSISVCSSSSASLLKLSLMPFMAGWLERTPLFSMRVSKSPMARRFIWEMRVWMGFRGIRMLKKTRTQPKIRLMTDMKMTMTHISISSSSPEMTPAHSRIKTPSTVSPMAARRIQKTKRARNRVRVVSLFRSALMRLRMRSESSGIWGSFFALIPSSPPYSPDRGQTRSGIPPSPRSGGGGGRCGP